MHKVTKNPKDHCLMFNALNLVCFDLISGSLFFKLCRLQRVKTTKPHPKPNSMIHGRTFFKYTQINTLVSVLYFKHHYFFLEH